MKNFWNKTYLGKLFACDPLMAKGISVIFIIYIFIHVFRLEMYPLYMFAMFSKQEQPREVYFTYSLYSKNEKVNPRHIDFRKYTVLMNTISQYDDIISNKMIHPESSAIDKFIARLHLDNSQLKNELKGNFTFDKTELNSHLGPWILKYLDLPQEEIRIEKESYSWKKHTPQIFNKIVIYELDQ